LHPISTVEQSSKFFRKELSEIESLIARVKQKLFIEREKRIKPFRERRLLRRGTAHAFGVGRSDQSFTAANLY
jgi:hypothetical protein